MKINLRFGMHRDIPLIKLEANKIDGIIVPGHILAYQAAPTSVFVASMPEHPYVIDPMTYIFQHEKGYLENEEGEVRRSIARLCEEYHESLVGILESLEIDESMRPRSFPPTKNFCEGVVSFQRNVVREKSTTGKAAKYIKRYSRQAHTDPRFVVAPYFRFRSVRDEWYRFSLRCAEETQKICDREPIGVVLYCSADNLNAAFSDTIAEDYRNFEHIMIWLDDFNEVAVSRENIIEARRLINVLEQNGAEVEALYGGYLLILMKFEGLIGISHGILYTQHKSFNMVPGGGGVPERYYVPKLHGFRSLSQTDLILHQHRDLMCTCEVCEEVMNGDPDKIILFADEPDLLRRHFINVRRDEADGVEDMNLEDTISRLRQNYQSYHSSIKSMPNPDSILSFNRMRGLEYLSIWADGLEATI